MNLDMGWGNPEFLFTHYERMIDLCDSSPEKYIFGSKDSLKEEIKKLHENVQNCVVQNKYIVIGNGATQILDGLFHIFGGYRNITFKSPHFPRFKDLANKRPPVYYGEQPNLEVITTPNNPDNKITPINKDEWKVWDLCYNWPIYAEVQNADVGVAVFSMSKLTGHAATRIGWAVIENKTLAEQLEWYIEVSTSGVSSQSQDLAERSFVGLNDQISWGHDHYTIIAHGKRVLEERWKRINETTFPFTILNSSGMFLWCKGVCPEGIDSVPGTAFGIFERDYFRLNIGCNDDTFDKFLEKFK
jgi:aspartate/methionine/tyrosine aminotransferase